VILGAKHSLSLVALAVCFAVALAPRATGAKPQAAELQEEYARLSEAHAAATPGWRPVAPASGSLVFVAPDQYTASAQSDERYRDQRNRYADALFVLAQQAVEAGELSLAFQWATEAVRENPDHAAARRVLGYVERDGQWITPYAARMADAGKRWHLQQGWIEDDDVAPPTPANKNRWQVRTDHFLVTSDLNLASAVELAAQLERLYQVWQQLFAGFGYSEREVRELFAGERSPRERNRPFRVFLHRDRDTYNAALARRQPRIAETLGIYFDRDREAHFFAGDDQDPGTLYHEAVHQLFQESRPAARNVGGTANFWIVEGIATYFESLAEHADPVAGLYFTIGESSAGRLPAARHRLLVDGFYIPLAEVTVWNKNDLQRQPELAKVYSQAAGQSAFLMDGGDAHYRESLVRYLAAVYAGRDDARSLEKFTGRSLGELDAEYRQFLQRLPE
jgi:hypothetical protein